MRQIPSDVIKPGMFGIGGVEQKNCAGQKW
jgi:hypothetical protein